MPAGVHRISAETLKVRSNGQDSEVKFGCPSTRLAIWPFDSGLSNRSTRELNVSATYNAPDQSTPTPNGVHRVRAFGPIGNGALLLQPWPTKSGCPSTRLAICPLTLGWSNFRT